MVFSYLGNDDYDVFFSFSISPVQRWLPCPFSFPSFQVQVEIILSSLVEVFVSSRILPQF